MSIPCVAGPLCKNSPDNLGEQLSKCALCRLSPDNIDRHMAHYWKPMCFAGPKDNPVLENEKWKKRLTKRIQKLATKNARDPQRRKVSRLAQQAEKATEKRIIHATKNSGRSNKDGDHVAFESITIDTKLQTTKTNPTIHLDELEKVRRDSVRAGTIAGCLIIRNKNGIGCAVFREEDLPHICIKKENR